MLRERIPDFDLAFGVSRSQLTVPRVRQPVEVSFRFGSDMSGVLQAVLSSRNVVLQAAPGAGKSTRFPSELAKLSAKLVLHVFPSERLASHVSRYVNQVGGDVQLLLAVGDPYPESGVACMSASLLVAKWLAAGEVVLPDCYLFHDEAHESDAYTYLVKALAPVAKNMLGYVSATATSGASGFRTYEPQGAVDRGVFEEPVSAWDPYDVQKPWSINSMRNNALLFVDSKTAAVSLVEAYASAGFMAFRLTSRMELGAFDVAMKAMSDPNNPVVVMVADSSYRSGFTFEVGTIVDAGKVGYLQVMQGRPVRRERVLYELESYQTLARGARMPGLSTKYWSPGSIRPEAAICDLQPVEVDAVALVMRLLGFRPPKEFEASVMAEGLVPRDLCLALQREQPLATMRPEQLVELTALSAPSGRKSPFLAADVEDRGSMPLDMADIRVSADTARSVDRQRLSPKRDSFQPLGFDEAAAGGLKDDEVPRKTKHGNVHPGWDDSWQDDLENLMRTNPGVRELKLGRAYYASGLDTDSDESVVFPDGVDSVLRLMQDRDRHGSLVGMSSWHKSVAVNLLLSRQGALAAEMDGVRRVLKAASRDGQAVGTPAARKLATRIAERLAAASASLHHVNEVLMSLGSGFCSYHEMEINTAVSDEVFSSWMSAWRGLPAANNQASLQAGYSISRESGDAMRGLTSEVKTRLLDRPYVPMARKGGGMRAIGPGATRALTSVSSSGTVNSDDRCVGSTHWRTTMGSDASGNPVMVRRLVCERCGVGASKKAHGMRA